MNMQQIEDRYIRSFDEPLHGGDRESLAEAIKAHPHLARELSHYKTIREAALRSRPDSFGPYFARKVMARIQNVGVQIDRQILLFFKKYQLAAIGVVVALFALNALLADRVTIPSLFGLEETSQPADEIMSFDFSDILNNDL